MRWVLTILFVVLVATFPQLAQSVVTEPLVWAFGGGIVAGTRWATVRRWYR